MKIVWWYEIENSLHSFQSQHNPCFNYRLLQIVFRWVNSFSLTKLLCEESQYNKVQSYHQDMMLIFIEFPSISYKLYLRKELLCYSFQIIFYIEIADSIKIKFYELLNSLFSSQWRTRERMSEKNFFIRTIQKSLYWVLLAIENGKD